MITDVQLLPPKKQVIWLRVFSMGKIL